MRAGDLARDELLELDPGGVVIPFAGQPCARPMRVCVGTMPSRVSVSGRRFIERPACYTLLVNMFPFLLRLGVPASVLASVNGPRIVRC